MWWRKKQSKETLSYDEVALLLLKFVGDVVKSDSKALKKGLPRNERFKLEDGGNELFCLFAYSIPHLWQDLSGQSDEQKRRFDEIWASHLRNVFDDEQQWQALQERFSAYTQIANEECDISARLFRYTTTLGDYCDIPFIHFVPAVTAFFHSATTCVVELAKYTVSPDQ